MMRARGVLLLAAALAFGCARATPRSCAVDADCPTGALCNAGACQAREPVVQIVSPAATAYTNGPIRLEVSVANATSEKVDLVANGALIASLGMGSAYTWDTSSFAEGRYEVVARATVGGQEVSSAARTVIVDRTPPAIVSRDPSPGDANVSVDATFRVTFSEPVQPERITDATVLLTAGGGSALSKHLALSPDGKTLTVALAARPQPPTTVTVDFQGVVDLAGNALTLATDAWSFSIPDWWSPWPLPLNGGTANGSMLRPAIALDPVGAMWVAYVEIVANQQELHVKRWDGRAWNELGAALNVIGDAYEPALAIGPDGIPTIAWIESAPIHTYDGTARMYVFTARWNGAAWTSLTGDRLDSSQATNINKWIRASSTSVALALNGAGNPTIAWPETAAGTASAPANLFVAQWNGTGWIRLGTPQTVATDNLLAAALALDGDNPVVAFAVSPQVAGPTTTTTFVRRWDGSTWTSPFGTAGFSGGNLTYHGPAIALDASGHPVLAYHYNSGAGISTIVERWNEVPTGWTELKGSAPGVLAFAQDCALQLDGAGDPWLAYVDLSPSWRLRVARWDPLTNSWARVGSEVTTLFAGAPALALTKTGTPVVAWGETANLQVPTGPIAAKKLNR